MADQKISQLTTIVTVDNATDLFPIVDTSVGETKKITPTALKTALSLNNVDNTTDALKPISTATQTALNAKQDTLVSATNIKTVNSTSLLGSGDIVVGATPSGVAGAIQFSDGTAFSSDAANLFFDNTNNRLGVGTNSPTSTVQIKGSGATSATTSLLVQNSAGTSLFEVKNDGNIPIFGGRLYDGANAEKSFYISGNNNIVSNYQSVSLRVFNGTAYASALEVLGNGAESRVGIGTDTPNASAKLQADSTTKGFLPPRMTTTQKNAISSPAAGLMVYDTTLNKLCVRTASTWETITSS